MVIVVTMLILIFIIIGTPVSFSKDPEKNKRVRAYNASGTRLIYNKHLVNVISFSLLFGGFLFAAFFMEGP